MKHRIGTHELPVAEMRFYTCMISCEERTAIRRQTLRNLAETDWAEANVDVIMDEKKYPDRLKNILHTAFRALERCLETPADCLVYFEDDLAFNRFLRYNLARWRPLNEQRITWAGLYNPGIRSVFHHPGEHFFEAHPHYVFGTQAMLLSRATVEFLLNHWNEVDGPLDIRISRLAARLQRPLYFHAPSLVQHTGQHSVWGGRFHQAADFDPDWKTEARGGCAAASSLGKLKRPF